MFEVPSKEPQYFFEDCQRCFELYWVSLPADSLSPSSSSCVKCSSLPSDAFALNREIENLKAQLRVSQKELYLKRKSGKAKIEILNHALSRQKMILRGVKSMVGEEDHVTLPDSQRVQGQAPLLCTDANALNLELRNLMVILEVTKDELDFDDLKRESLRQQM